MVSLSIQIEELEIKPIIHTDCTLTHTRIQFIYSPKNHITPSILTI